jgi:CheY-like chemotaxis protein
MEFSPQQVTNEVRNPARDLRRLLVIDDDACIGAAIRAIMAYHHCDTVHETRANAGISALKQFAFDVVMVDIFLPGSVTSGAIHRFQSSPCRASVFGAPSIPSTISGWRHCRALHYAFASH